MQEDVDPDNVIPAEPNTSRAELAGAFVTNHGERRWNVVRLGVQLAQFAMVARTSTPDGDTNDQFQELKPRGNSDDANR